MRRNDRIVIRVTHEEKEELKKRAEAFGFDTVTGFVKWATKEKIFQIQKTNFQNGSKN